MFKERFKTLRQSKGLSQYRLADELGISRARISNYELGEREPNFSTLCMIADYFGVTTDYLLGRSLLRN